MTRQKPQNTLIVGLEITVILLCLLCTWLILSKPECPTCKEQPYSAEKDGPECFEGLSCQFDPEQKIMIEYYSENNFTIIKNGSKETISTIDIMRNFNEQNIEGEENKQPEEYIQYLCLTMPNATSISCIPAAIFW